MTVLFDEARAELEYDREQLKRLLSVFNGLLKPIEQAYHKYDLCGRSWDAVALDIGDIERCIERLEKKL